MRLLTFTVRDLPAAQGSKRHVGRGILIESSKQVKPWREAVKHAALAMMDELAGAGAPFETLTGPVTFEAVFSLPRPKSHYRTGRNANRLRGGAPIAPARTPDLDKVLRSTWDALTAAGVWHDDAQVVEDHSAKVYVGHAMPYVGARITVKPYLATRCQVCGDPADDAVCAGCGGAA